MNDAHLSPGLSAPKGNGDEFRLDVPQPSQKSPERPSPTEMRQLLIEGAREFQKKFVPKTPEEMVDDAVAKGRISLAGSGHEDLTDENYFGIDSDCVVVSSQAAIAVYENRRGDIVIRQERNWDEDEDHLILIHPSNLPLLIQALQACLASGAGGQAR
ncbi:hypothetical protein [Bradyrhizobium sp. STM 3562]|uniref:hypothetical protein n=1 Tax=Bradyrhizobium sp. STM 3562 TaxID=578924 RepID=UPI003890F09A